MFRKLPLVLLLLIASACGDSGDVDQTSLVKPATDSAARKSSDGASPGMSSPGGSASKSQGEPQDSALPVRTYRVSGKVVDDAISTTGELRANEEVDLRSEDEGRIVDLRFEEGQTVSRGELLVKINDADLVAEQRRLEVQRDLAQRREQRSMALLEEQTLSQDVYEEARGRLQELEAQLEQVAAEIEKTEIRAPFAGIVGLRHVSRGSLINSSTTIARLQDLDPIKLDFSVPEKYAGELGAGDTVTFTVSGNNRTFEGRVYAVEPRIDPATRTVQVRARAANSEYMLFPGAFAKVRVVLSREDDALMVPSIALIPGAEGTTVYVAVDGRAEPRAVEVGQRTEDRVQILTGLQAGDRVIVSGIQQMRPGLKIEAVEIEAVEIKAIEREFGQ